MNFAIYALMFLMIAMIGITIYALFLLSNKMKELQALQVKTISIANDLINLDKTKDIVDCLSLMGRSYIKLSNSYDKLQEQHIKIVELVNEIQERYCDSYEQFEHCKNELEKIKEMFYDEDSKEIQNGSEKIPSE